jgi:hypothetical protein
MPQIELGRAHVLMQTRLTETRPHHPKSYLNTRENSSLTWQKHFEELMRALDEDKISGTRYTHIVENMGKYA